MSAKTTHSRTRTALLAVSAALTFVPTLLHELTHLLFAAPWAERVHISIGIKNADAQAGIDWRGGVESVPDWGIWLSAYGPALIGAVVGIWGVARLVSGGVPESPSTLLVVGVLAIWWAVFALPSGDDRNHSATGDNDMSNTNSETEA